MKKKILLFVLAGIMATMCLSACGNKEEETASESSKTEIGEMEVYDESSETETDSQDNTKKQEF